MLAASCSRGAAPVPGLGPSSAPRRRHACRRQLGVAPMMSHQAGQDRTQPASSVQWRAPSAQQPASPPRQPPIWPPLPLPSLGPFTPNQVAALFVAYTFMVSVSWGAWTIGKQVEGLKLEIHEMSRDVMARLDQQSDLMLSAQLDQLSGQMRQQGVQLDQLSAQVQQLLLLDEQGS